MDEATYWRSRREGGAYWLADRSWLRFSGQDVPRFLNGQCTNDVRNWDGTRSLRAAIVSAKGRLFAEIYLARDRGGNILMDGPGELAGALVGRLARYIVADDVSFAGPGPDFHVMHAWGKAIGALRSNCWISANNRIGPEGADIFCEGPVAHDIGEWLCPPEVRDVLRVEAGVPAWGREMDGDTLLPEVGSPERWVSYTKGCYIGQEIISRLKSVGHVNRHMVGLVIANGDAPPPGSPILANGKVLGHTTTQVWSPSMQKIIALGFIGRHDSETGTGVDVGGSSATIVALPFVT